MSSPADVDLGDLYLQRQAELEGEDAIARLEGQLAGLQPAQPGEPENPTPQLQDPSAPPIPGQAEDGGVSAGDVAKDVGVGLLQAIPREIPGGALDALREFSEFMTEGLPVDKPFAQQLPEIEGSGTVTGGLVRKAAQFLGPFAVAGRAKAVKSLYQLGRAGAIANPALRGMAADFFAFDPDEQRLSNLVQEVPELANPVNEYFAADPADSDLEGRFKQSIEGLGLGVAGEAVTRAVRGLRAMRAAKAAAGLDQPGAREALEVVDAQRAELSSRTGDPAAPALEVRPRADAPDQPGEVFVNWGPIQAPDDVKQLIQDLANARAGNIDTARRGVRSWAVTRASAAELDAWEVLRSRRGGQPLNSDETVAVRELWIQSGKRVRELARAVEANGGELDEIALQRQLLIHNVIQEQVIPARTETARAFNAWAIPVGDAVEFSGQLDQLRLLAQTDRSRLRELAGRINQLSAAGLDREADAFLEASAGAKTAAAVRQLWYSNLLSNPRGIVRDFTSNLGNLLLDVPETMVASAIGRLRGEQFVPDGEAMQRLFGLVQGYQEFWTMAQKSRDAFEAGLDELAAGNEEAARAIVRADVNERFASGIAEATGGARPLEFSRGRSEGAFDPDRLGWGRGTPWGAAASFLDSATTASQRIRMRGDELAKAMGYHMELRAQAFRKVTDELRSGAIAREAFSDRLAEVLASPTEAMRLAARSHAERKTFSNAPESTALWRAVRGWHDVPVLGDITMPFARTPYNIATQVMQRTPAAPFMKSWAADIRAGGARADLARARFVTGNAILASVAGLAMSGRLTGAGPSDPGERAALERTGWKPWSVKIGDRFYDYRAFEPIGPLLGLSAATVDILRAKDFGDAEAEQVLERAVVATTAAIAAQVTNQSYMTGATEFFNVMQDPQRYGEKYVQRLATSAVVPRGVAAVERVTDPNQRYAWNLVDSIRSQTPGLSADLPPARDRWGRPRTSASGFGPWFDLLSPVGSSQYQPEPIDLELGRLEHWVGMPGKTIGVGGVDVELAGRPREYSRFVELAGNAAKDPSGRGLLDTLNDLVGGKHENSPSYAELTDGPDGSKALMIDRYVRLYQELAKRQLLEEFPALRAEMERKRREHAEALTPAE